MPMVTCIDRLSTVRIQIACFSCFFKPPTMFRPLISRSRFTPDFSRLLGRAPVVRALSSTTSKPTQSVAHLAPLGVAAALHAASDPSFVPRPKIFDEFALTDRVAIVSGGNGGIGLEMALTLCEAGARAVYCFDLPESPSAVWQTTRDYVAKMNNGSRLEYQSVDVTDQDRVCSAAARIGDQEKRMDVCVAAAGILRANIDCLDTPGDIFREVRNNLRVVLLLFSILFHYRSSMSIPPECSSLPRLRAVK